MMSKADIRSRLQNEILSLQGFKPLSAQPNNLGLGPINRAFPNAVFPLAAVHEFFSHTEEEAAAANGFLSALLSSLLQKGGAAFWIGGVQRIFPPALLSFGIRPEQIFFAHLKNAKDLSWGVEEVLQCNSLSAVVCEMRELSFTASRRFQLLIEKSGVPLFVLRRRPANLATAAVTRWHIRSVSSTTDEYLPGVGHPRWEVALLKVRNGQPGKWVVEWRNGRFYHPSKLAAIGHRQQTKTG